MSNSQSSSFSWLDTLEKEFDKSAAQLQTFVNECIDEEVFTDQSLEELHRALETVSSLFAQVGLKAQLAFQLNAKLEAQMLDLRSQLSSAAAARSAAEKEVNVLLIELHKAHLEMAELTDTRADFDSIRQSLQAESERRVRESMVATECQVQLDASLAEIVSLRERISNLESDLFASRIAAKYLDKELVGRIQQLQLLLKDSGAQSLRSEEAKSVWQQLDTEIQLHRHKAIIRACQFNATANAANASKNRPVAASSASAAPVTTKATTATKAPPKRISVEQESESETESEEESETEETESDQEPVVVQSKPSQNRNKYMGNNNNNNNNNIVTTKSKTSIANPLSVNHGRGSMTQKSGVNTAAAQAQAQAQAQPSTSRGRKQLTNEGNQRYSASADVATVPPGMPSAYQSGLNVSPYPVPSSTSNAANSNSNGSLNNNNNNQNQTHTTHAGLPKIETTADVITSAASRRFDMRRVQIVRDTGSGADGAGGGLGLSIMGGREHGLPIVVSEVHPNTPAERCGLISVGDTIVRVNGTDVRNAAHCDAVRALTQRTTLVDLEIMHVELSGSEEENENENENEDEQVLQSARHAPAKPSKTKQTDKKVKHSSSNSRTSAKSKRRSRNRHDSASNDDN